jgi:hypothetical protein
MTDVLRLNCSIKYGDVVRRDQFYPSMGFKCITQAGLKPVVTMPGSRLRSIAEEDNIPKGFWSILRKGHSTVSLTE